MPSTETEQVTGSETAGPSGLDIRRTRRRIALGLLLLFATAVLVAELTVVPREVVADPAYALPILIATFLFSPAWVAGVATYSLVLHALAYFLMQPSPIWWPVLYLLGTASFAALGYALSVRIAREGALREQVQAQNEQLQAQARQLHTSNVQLEATIEHTYTMLAYLDDEFRFVKANQAYIEASGHTWEELAGRNHFDLFPNGENEVIFKHVRATGEIVEFHAKPFRFADQPSRGTTYWDWTLVPVKSQEGAIHGLVLSLLDVTAQVRAAAEREQMVAAREFESARWHAAIANMPEMVSVGDAKGRAIYINTAQQRLFGHVVEPLLDMENYPARYQLYQPDGTLFNARDLPLQRAALSGESVRGAEVVLRTPAGKDRFTLWDASPLRDTAGKLIGAVAIGRDVTEHRHVVQQLFETEKRLRLSFDQAPIGAAIVSLSLRIERANNSLCQLLGYATDELTTRPLALITHPDDLEGDMELSQHLVSGEIDHIQVDKRFLRKDGRIVWGRLSERVVTDSAGQPLYFNVTVEDITALRELQMEREKHVAELEELDRQKDDFISIAAHELRQPLSVVKGFAQLALWRLEKAVDIGDLPHRMRLIDGQIDRIAELLNRLLDVSRIRLGRLELRSEPVDLVHLARQAAADAQSTTARHRITVQAEDGELIGKWDAGRLGQMLVNLLSNAVHYSPEGGEVEVIVARENGKATISVRDEGVGIPPEEHEMLFTRYYRRRATTGIRAEGMGLGLYIVNGIVTAHGGEARVESAVGKGTTFHISLPLA